MRAHYTRPVTDQQGNLLPDVQVSVYEPGTTTLVADVLYSSATENAVLTNPFVSNTGIVDLYLDNPRRVRLGIITSGSGVQNYDDVDILAAGADASHAGTGLYSLALGPMATAVGNNSTALGQGANSPGSGGTAVGPSASAFGAQSVAVGASAVQGAGAVGVGDSTLATGDSSVAVGQGAVAAQAEGIAVGHTASAPYTHSTAIGAGSITTSPNQIMLGTATDVAEVPFGSGFVLHAPGGTRYKITVDDTGALITTAL